VPTDVRDYQKVISDLQSEIIIANLQAKIRNLQAQVLGAQTPSTVTESSAPDNRDTSNRMASIKSNMALMSAQFNSWMTEVRQLANPNQVSLLNQGAKHSQQDYPNEALASPSKRIDTHHTKRNDPTQTQPSPWDHYIRPFPTLDPPPQSPSSSAPETPDQHPPIPSHPYDIDRPQYLYLDNGDGSLFKVGIAGPGNFDANGNVTGPRPSQLQRNPHHIQGASPIQYLQPRSPSPMQTLATQETTDSSMNSSPPGPPVPQQITQSQVTASLQSLPT
jgi:hypothetical protein